MILSPPTIPAHNRALLLSGDASLMSDSARGGNDTLTVNNSGDSSGADLYGDASHNGR